MKTLCIDNPSSILALQKHGMAYVKVSDEIDRELKKIEAIGQKYFNQSYETKSNHTFNPDQREGFLDQSIRGVSIERYIFRGSPLLDETLASIEATMLFTRAYFKNEIILPLLHKIFMNLNLEACFDAIINEPDYTLSLLSYPKRDNAEFRIQPHKDAALVSALWSQKSGLQVYLNGQWKDVPPKEGHIVVQLGESLELMTDQQCYAAEHRVLVSEDVERFTVASFFSANLDAPFTNLVTGEEIAARFGDYIDRHVEKTYAAKETVFKKS